MKKLLLFVAGCFMVGTTVAQTNIISTNSIAEDVMLGNYDPATYIATNVISHPASVSQGILSEVSADSLHKYLEVLSSFGNRNTGSDTNSSVKGIGAARRWVHEKFEQFSAQNENRLLPSYLQFDQTICSIDQHRNIFAVLPGTDTTDKSIVIIEGHIDSRCEDVCDTMCLAEGMEDNGSGTALVMELARVMSKYSFKRSIVFLLTIGEEQGLDGATAFAEYCVQKGIGIRAVLNNDVIGGIICGQTSSPPSCMGANSIDSLNVRIFSSGGFNSRHKQLARFAKLEYKEMIAPFAAVPMTIHIMTPEDRTGRGGDHIPFRQKNFAAIRFTSANEHGDAGVTAPNYTDRQHTSTDVLGVDTDNDNIIDSFFVDFNYLARNAVINGNAAAMAAMGPEIPDFTVAQGAVSNTLNIGIIQQQIYPQYRVAIRTTTNDWDSVYTVTGATNVTINISPDYYIVSVAAVDVDGTESLFSGEKTVFMGVEDLNKTNNKVELLQNNPNPFDGETIISVLVNKEMKYKDAYISIRDLNGKELKRMDIALIEGMNEITYEHGYFVSGTYIYTLVIDGVPIQSRRMVFSN